ncbi:hypothetical protein OAO87_03660, partial [bacterium]|nr:hypothetical protein [bacterium]
MRRHQSMADAASDEATQVSGREAQRLAGLNADHATASLAAAAKRKERAMPEHERRAKRAQHKCDVRALKAS